jgi:magnesium transporter
MLGVLFGIALLITLVFAGLAGVAIPIVFDRLGVDPAVASGVFMTTVTDIVGFLSFLGLASLYLS